MSTTGGGAGGGTNAGTLGIVGAGDVEGGPNDVGGPPAITNPLDEADAGVVDELITSNQRTRVQRNWDGQLVMSVGFLTNAPNYHVQ